MALFPGVDAAAGEIRGEFSASYLACWCCPKHFATVFPRHKADYHPARAD